MRRHGAFDENYLLLRSNKFHRKTDDKKAFSILASFRKLELCTGGVHAAAAVRASTGGLDLPHLPNSTRTVQNNKNMHALFSV